MKPTVAVAISGGVDSMIAAYLLRARGYEVLGIHFLTGFEPAGSKWASTERQIHPVYRIGKQLDLPVTVVDCSTEFQAKVVDYFTQTYMRGQTPNPCVVCNPRIKFGTLMTHAEKLGAAWLATGHYARVETDGTGIRRLYRGADPKKDQSYFLARLSQQQLQRACFPLGAMTKTEVKALAHQKGLQPAAASESQDVCFIKADAYAEFLEAQPGFHSIPGKIEDMQGNVIGEHHGLHRFTVGQRRGINCPASEPYYVVGLDSDGNRLVVGAKADGLSRKCRVTGVSWIVSAPDFPCRVRVRVRYRHREVPASISRLTKDSLMVGFDTPQEAVTPGQAAVFYDQDEVIGGGFIQGD